VKNAATKEDETDSFNKYCELRDDPAKAFYIYKGCKRRWMNESDEERAMAGIHIVWPDLRNTDFKAALAAAGEGSSPNNISAIVKYSIENGVTVLWMGDLETEFMEAIEDQVTVPSTSIVFAPHHGRKTGRIPKAWLDEMAPRIIVVGEAPAEHLHYYQGYNTITQNTAGDILFDCQAGKAHVFTSLEYDVDFLANESRTYGDLHYVGTLNL